jgi:hypothetical protein
MADSAVQLRWEKQGLRFRGGRAGGPEVTVDGDGQAGPSPMQQLLIAVAACMGSTRDIKAANRARPYPGWRCWSGWRAPAAPALHGHPLCRVGVAIGPPGWRAWTCRARRIARLQLVRT